MKRSLPLEVTRRWGQRPSQPCRVGSTRKWLATSTVATAMLIGAAASPAGAQSAGSPQVRTSAPENRFIQTNLASNRSDEHAQLVDPNLQNPWGVSMTPTSPLWVSDNNSGVTTLYSINVGGTTVTKVPLTVGIPGGRLSTSDGSSPTGQVFNPTTGFVVSSPSGSGPATFIFASESGQITAWNPTADPTTAGMSTANLEFSSPTAVYKGLTLATGAEGTFLYASNFHDGTVDVFNSQFQLIHLAGDFTDPSLPPNYAPFGIQVIHNLIYVSYAMQNALKHDDVAGPGHGFVDVYSLDGFLVKRLASRGTLNSPWGLSIAPPGFGSFSGMLLVGNFGDGRINVFDPFSHRFLGQLKDEQHQSITIDDLWSLRAGTATTGGTQTLLFTAGINDQQDGLLGSINPAG
jgi:uncharacterized protein (TIGR03118 family)